MGTPPVKEEPVLTSPSPDKAPGSKEFDEKKIPDVTVASV